MHHVIHETSKTGKYDIALLVKEDTLNKIYIEEHYIDPLKTRGIKSDRIISFSLAYNPQGKAPVSLIRATLGGLLKALDSLGITTLLVADSAYFKTLTKKRKAVPHYGYILPCMIEGYEHMNVILTINYKQLFYDPNLQSKLDMSLDTVVGHVNNTHVNLGANIIHSEDYPDTVEKIENCLNKLHQYPALAVDTETFSLDIATAGLATIGFAWDQNNGIAFKVDFLDHRKIRLLLKKFFIFYKGKLLFWNAAFDIKVLIRTLYMSDLSDISGLIYGLNVFYKNMDDAQLITYLATNTTAGNHLSLKHNAFEYTGNYAQDDINDITKIPMQDLLRYNLTDCLATWYTYNKNYPIMIKDKQQDIYENLMRPSLKVITQMELQGMPLDLKQVNKTKAELSLILWKHEVDLQSSPIILNFEDRMRKEEMLEKNLLLKVKVKPLSDFIDVEFNPSSNKQVARLLHDELGLPVLDTTDTGQPSVGAKSLKKLINYLKNEYNL